MEALGQQCGEGLFKCVGEQMMSFRSTSRNHTARVTRAYTLLVLMIGILGESTLPASAQMSMGAAGPTATPEGECPILIKNSILIFVVEQSLEAIVRIPP